MGEIELTQPRLVKYNPAFLSDDDLVQGFVVRTVDHSLVLEAVRDNDSQPNAHVLVVGPRGSGKTSLLRRVTVSVKRDPDLGARWFPLIFAEESYQVASVGEFWLEALFHLAEQTDDPDLRKSHEELNRESDDVRLADRALALLLDFADTVGKRLLIVVENLHMLMEQIDEDDAWKIRHTLQGEHRLMLLASATTRLEAIDNADKAFYELFKVHELGPLNLEECHAVWTAAGGTDLPLHSVRPVQILTGGNLRLMTIISRFGANHSFKALLTDLMVLVDEHTEYFKSHLDGLASTERKIYLALAELWAPATASEAGQIARIDVHRASALLGRLVGRGAVTVVGSEAKKKLYQVTERLYNVYYLMRRRGSPSRRVKAAVNFMVGYYGPRELVGIAANVAREACDRDSPFRAEHMSAYEQILSHPDTKALGDQILRATPGRFFEDPEVPKAIRERASTLKARGARWGIPSSDSCGTTELMELLTSGGAPDNVAVEHCRGLIQNDPTKAAPWAIVGYFLTNIEEYEEAEAALREAIRLEPRYVWAWARLGWLLHWVLGRHDEKTEHVFRTVVELDPEYPIGWALLGSSLAEPSGRYEEAERAYQRTVQIDPSLGWAWFNLGIMLENLQRYEEAERAYRRAIDIDPPEALMWARLGDLLYEKLERHEEAMAAYRTAVEIDPQHASSWSQLGELLHERFERYEEAEVAYRHAIEIDAQLAWTWGQFGVLLEEHLDRAEEAEKAYRRALEIQPQLTWIWAQLGRLLHERLERLHEAEAVYRKGIEIDSQYALLWSQLGRLLEQLERFDEAEVAYRRVLESEPQSALGWAQLGLLLHYRFGRYDDAAVAYREVTKLEPKAPLGWEGLLELAGLGALAFDEVLSALDEQVHDASAEMLNECAWALFRHGPPNLYPRAEAWARAAVERDPNEASAAHTHASVLCALDRVDEALGAVRPYLEQSDAVEATVEDAVELFVELAVRGATRRVLALLQASPNEPLLEALIVALQLDANMPSAAVPREVLEVAEDIRRDIDARRAARRAAKAAAGQVE